MENSEKIVFLYRSATVPDLIVEAARAQTPDGFELIPCEMSMDPAERRRQVAEADYLMLYAVGFEDLDVARKARLMQILSAGYDKLDVPALAAAGIPLATNGGANAPTVAEHALLLMLAVYRKLPLHHSRLTAGEWLGHREVLGLRELRGKQVGIVGFGKIGREVARMVNGFLAQIVYHDVMPVDPAVEAALSARRMPLDDLFATSDIVTLHMPLDPASRALINRDVLVRMKSTSILINTARGPVVNEPDLIAALQAGTIAGAGLDVFEAEPLATDSPLLAMDNVVVTPHTAGSTIDTWWRRLDFAFENITRVSRGEEPLFVVPG